MPPETKVAEDPQAEVAEQEAEPEGAPEAKVAEGTKQEAEPETLPFKTQVELDAHIEKEVQRRAMSISSKSTLSYQQQVDDLKNKLKSAEMRKAEEVEDTALTRLEKKQQEVYGSEEDLPDFLEAQKALLLKAREFKKKETEFEEKYSKATTNIRQQQAFTKALELYLVPEDSEEFFTAVKAFAKKLGEAESDREMDLLYALEEERLKRLAEAKPNTREAKPDVGVGSAPGGKTFSADTPKETISEGVRRLKIT